MPQTLQRETEPRWLAVERRDARADGKFVYAVRTTGVYCRPSCAARRAKRENVEFFPAPADAERAGFRACKRCRPKDDATAIDDHAAAIALACRALAGSSDAALDLNSLASSAGLSPSHFHRTFKRHTGLTPKAYAAAHRSHRLRDALPRSTDVTSAMHAAGFNSSARLYDTAPSALGMAPGVFRAGGTGASIRYALGQCSLGTILVAASDRGVCAIFLGDDAEPLERDLAKRFPAAERISRDKPFSELLDQVIAFVDTPKIGWSLPLDVRGTAFQHRVWQALRKIPLGETRTYGQLAATLGTPKSTRAVARACGANPVAVAIPCHRVIGKTGALTGYHWGVERKAKLLKREQDADPA